MSNAKDAYVNVAAGHDLFKSGDAAESIYIVESGQLDVVHDKPAGAADYQVGPGEFLGEAAVMEGHTYGVSARARSNCRLLRLDRASFADIVRHTPDIGLRLICALSDRQGHSRRALVQALHAQAVPAPVKAAPAPARPTPTAPPLAEPAPPKPEAVAAKAESKHLALRAVETNQVIELDAQRDELQVGRLDPNTGATPDVDLGPFDSARTLSRRHAKILRDGDAYFICEDAPTTNGTFLNGTRLQTGSRSALNPGDRLRFGSIEVEVVVGT